MSTPSTTIASVLRLFSWQDTIKTLVGAIGFTDVIGYLTNEAKAIYNSQGRTAVVNALTIKEVSLRQWATSEWTATGRDVNDADYAAFEANVVAKQSAVADAVADFVGALIPATSTPVPEPAPFSVPPVLAS